MTLTRRGFMQSILALGAAPYVLRAEALMPVRVPHFMREPFFRLSSGLAEVQVNYHQSFVRAEAMRRTPIITLPGLASREVFLAGRDLQLGSPGDFVNLDLTRGPFRLLGRFMIMEQSIELCGPATISTSRYVLRDCV